MTTNVGAVFRVRPSGNNANGGGYDTGYYTSSPITAAATGTHGQFTAANTFVDATASAFTSGMTGAAIYIAGVGQFTVTYVSSTTITLTGTTRVTNFNSSVYHWAVGPGTDYSQQNSAQATGTAGTAAGTATFTDATAANFTSAMVGNALFIASGSGFTVGVYFVVAFTSSSVVTLDRSPGTGSAAVWKLGGGWADFTTNTQNSQYLSSGNTIYILGSGTPNPASYTYDYTSSANVTPVQGSLITTFANDPMTPAGGFPCIRANGTIFENSQNIRYSGLWFVVNSTPGGGVLTAFSGDVVCIGCVVDFFGFSAGFLVGNTNSSALMLIGCEFTSSVSISGTGPQAAANYNFVTAFGNNFHGLGGSGTTATIRTTGPTGAITFNVFTECLTGIEINGNGVQSLSVQNNTFNECKTGLKASGGSYEPLTVFNNIFANMTTAGIDVSSILSLPTGDYENPFTDYNTFYNNTTNISGLSNGPHDTILSSSPFVNGTSNPPNLTLVSGLFNAGVVPPGPLPQNITGFYG